MSRLKALVAVSALFGAAACAPTIGSNGFQAIDKKPADIVAGTDTKETVLARLCRNLGPGDILLLHDGHAARTADGQPVILAVLPRLLATLRDQQLNPVTLNDAIT